MTRVEFFTNVPNKHAKALNLCEKALAKGRQLTLLAADEAEIQDLQAQLWNAAPTQFLANTLAENAHAGITPIVLCVQGSLLHQDDVCINLQDQTPVFFSRFRHFVELVGLDENDKAQARERFKFYRDRGYQIKTTPHEA